MRWSQCGAATLLTFVVANFSLLSHPPISLPLFTAPPVTQPRQVPNSQLNARCVGIRIYVNNFSLFFSVQSVCARTCVCLFVCVCELCLLIMALIAL